MLPFHLATLAMRCCMLTSVISCDTAACASHIQRTPCDALPTCPGLASALNTRVEGGSTERHASECPVRATRPVLTTSIGASQVAGAGGHSPSTSISPTVVATKPSHRPSHRPRLRIDSPTECRLIDRVWHPFTDRAQFVICSVGTIPCSVDA